MLEKSFKSLVREKRLLYKNIGSIYCPILDVRVTFNGKGFNHLLRDGKGKKRNRSEATDRLNLLHKAPDIIRNANKIHKHRFQKGSEYWALEEGELTVILKKTGNSNVCFWSIWKRD